MTSQFHNTTSCTIAECTLTCKILSSAFDVPGNFLRTPCSGIAWVIPYLRFNFNAYPFSSVDIECKSRTVSTVVEYWLKCQTWGRPWRCQNMVLSGFQTITLVVGVWLNRFDWNCLPLEHSANQFTIQVYYGISTHITRWRLLHVTKKCTFNVLFCNILLRFSHLKYTMTWIYAIVQKCFP
jgi:hypothetical protein